MEGCGGRSDSALARKTLALKLPEAPGLDDQTKSKNPVGTMPSVPHRWLQRYLCRAQPTKHRPV